MSEREDLCEACWGAGDWWTECCSGAGGCSCHGQPIHMGGCLACGGSGLKKDVTNPRANIESIQGYGFIGTGPTGGWFGVPAMGKE